MKRISKSNAQLVAVCMFCAVSKTIEYHDFSKYYGEDRTEQI